MSATLKFRYATMGSGKSAEIISIIRNYEECGFDGLTLIPKIDVDSNGEISSRNGYKVKAIIFDNNDNVLDLVKKEIESGRDIKYVIVDESQFLTEDQVWQLTDIVDYLKINVLAYGLLTDSFTNFFPGSDLLTRVADVRQELTTVHRLCPVCGKKAIINARVVNGEVIKEGEQVQIKNQDEVVHYIPLCRAHFKEGVWKR
jgi:thymidine kinase